MKDYNSIPVREFNFGMLFVVANRLDTMLERELKEFDITTKQWFLSIVIGGAFSEPPTIKQAAKQMGCSHQNAKQVAKKLENKGLLKMEKDKHDGRVTRLMLTEKSDELWKGIAPKGDTFMNKVFEGLTSEEMEVIRKGLLTMLMNLEEMDARK